MIVTINLLILLLSYVITNYDNSTFSVAQSRFDDGAQSQIISIRSDNSTAPTTPFTESHISRSTIIGVATGSSIALILVLIVIGFLIRRWRIKVKSRTEKDLSIGDTITEAKTSIASFPQEIGRNSLQKSRPELHDEPTAELLDHGTISGSDKKIQELPHWQGETLHELDTGTMQYSELSGMPTAELPSQDTMPGSGKEIKKLSSGSTHILQGADPISDSSPSTAASGPREMHRDRFSFLRIREQIAMASPMGASNSSAKRWSDALLVKPRPPLAVASSKSLPQLPLSKYNTRSKSPSPPRDHV